MLEVLDRETNSASAAVYELLESDSARAEALALRIVDVGSDAAATERAAAALALGWCRLRHGSAADAIACADEALVLLEGDEDRRSRARAYQLMAGAHHALGEHDAGFRAARQAATLFDQPPPSSAQHAGALRRVAQIGAGVAHDIRDMLTAILGYAELAESEVDSGGDPTRSIQRIREASLHAHTLVREVLHFSRRTVRKMQPLRLQPLLREAAEMLRAQGPACVLVREDLDPAVGPVRGDAAQLQRIAMNLLHNACEAMHATAGVLTVALEEQNLDADDCAALPGLEPGRHVVLRVRDVGCGMDDETRRRMFEPQFTTRGDVGGKGIGLSVVAGLVAGHGGALSVDSALGNGTTVSVYFRRESE